MNFLDHQKTESICGTLTLCSSSEGSPGSRSGLLFRCSLQAYTYPPAASSFSEHPSTLQKTGGLINKQRNTNENQKNKKAQRRADLSSWPGPPSPHTAVGVSGPPLQAWLADYWKTQTGTEGKWVSEQSFSCIIYGHRVCSVTGQEAFTVNSVYV